MCSEISVSIIIPAWNEAKVIRNTLDELSEIRVATPTEIIIVAGGQDSTYKLCENWVEKDKSKFDICKCLPQKAAEGKIGALKKGYMKSRGDYLIFLDADTLVPEDWLERITEELQTYDAISCNYEPKQYDIIATAQPLINKWAALAREQKILRGGASIGIRREIIKEIGTDNIFPKRENVPADDIFLNRALVGNDKDIGPLIRDVTVKTHFPTSLFQLYRIKVRWNSIRYDLTKGNTKILIKTFFSSAFVAMFPLNVLLVTSSIAFSFDKKVLLVFLLVLIPSFVLTIPFLKERINTARFALQETSSARYWLLQFFFVEYTINLVITSVYFQRFIGIDSKIQQFREER